MQSDQSDSANLGDFLRTLRKQRRLSIEQAAQAAGIHRVTLYRWERGDTVPRLTELSALLNGLGANREQRRQAVTLMDAPRARTLVRGQVARVAERAGIGAMPHGGELLRAMRMRRGLELEAIAFRVGVTSGTLRRWERGDTWPSVAQLHALCFALGAKEAEMTALTCGEFTHWSLAGQATASSEKATTQAAERALEELLHRFLPTVRRPPNDLKDLELLTLQAQAWMLATRSPAGLTLLGHVYAATLDYLGFRDRYQEYMVVAGRFFELFPDIPQNGQNRDYWLSTRTFAARYRLMAGGRVNPQRSIEELRQVSAITSGTSHQPSSLQRLSEIFQQQGAYDESLQASEESFGAAQRNMGDEYAGWNRGEWGICLIQAGHYEKGLSMLSTGNPGDLYRLVETSLWRAQALLGMGENREAQSWLTTAQSDLTRYDVTPLQPRLNDLQAQLNAA